jgi:predicted dehydrogenase
MIKGAIIGTGFWSNYQLSAWRELQGVDFIAVYNRTKEKAQSFAKRFNIENVYDDVVQMLDEQRPDFVDIITNPETHLHFTELAASRGIDVICQKPMADDEADAQKMLDICNTAGVKLFIHENFRWQAPIRALKQLIDAGTIGKIFKGQISFCSAFPVFDNQPFLAEAEHFILTDIGSHVLDICRFLFGEAETLFCLTHRVNPSIKGEDVANVLMKMKNDIHCFAEMSYASIREKESFPQTLAFIEGDGGSIQLTHDFVISVTTKSGTTTKKAGPALYDWADPAYAVVHSGIVECNRDILNGLNGGISETTGTDNLQTVKLVWAAYESAASKKSIQL